MISTSGNKDIIGIIKILGKMGIASSTEIVADGLIIFPTPETIKITTRKYFVIRFKINCNIPNCKSEKYCYYD